MTTPELVSRWAARRDELRRLSALVDGATLLDEVLVDLEDAADAEPLVSLTAAAPLTGYTADHLSRLIRHGSLTSYGKKGRPSREAQRVSEESETGERHETHV